MSEEVKEETPVVEAAPATPEADISNEPREARRGSRERNPNARERGVRETEKSQFLERVVTINRVSKVVRLSDLDTVWNQGVYARLNDLLPEPLVKLFPLTFRYYCGLFTINHNCCVVINYVEIRLIRILNVLYVF